MERGAPFMAIAVALVNHLLAGRKVTRLRLRPSVGVAQAPLKYSGKEGVHSYGNEVQGSNVLLTMNYLVGDMVSPCEYFMVSTHVSPTE